VPEIDMPGHAPVGFSYEAVTSKHGNIVQCTELKYSTGLYSAEPPSGQWNLSNPSTFEILAGILKQLSEDFSTAPFIHIGGDEINTNCMTANDRSNGKSGLKG
jgi:N-acetyl-beta-hexosaminidase